MSTTEVIDPADVICGLKAAVTALECYHNMNLLKQQQKTKPKKPPPPPMYMMIPIEEEVDIKKPFQSFSEIKFPEMRSGILFSRCNCIHRDGLQDSCPLSQCQGQVDCLVKPWPICPPAMYLRSRHPELYSMSSQSQ